MRAPSLDQGLQTTPGVLMVPLFFFLCRGKTFRGTTIGMAPLEGMCSMDNSGGVSMVREAWGSSLLVPAGGSHCHSILLEFFTWRTRIWGWS